MAGFGLPMRIVGSERGARARIRASFAWAVLGRDPRRTAGPALDVHSRPRQ